MARRFTDARLTQDAKGGTCLLQIAGVGFHNPETVVACHAPSEWKGTGIKSPDWATVRGCMECHSIVDRRAKNPLTGAYITAADLDFYWKRGLLRQWDEWIERGILCVTDGDQTKAGGSA